MWFRRRREALLRYALRHLSWGNGDRESGYRCAESDRRYLAPRGRREDNVRALNEGIMSQMPAHRDLLSPAQIHLAALYVFSLSTDSDAARVPR